MFCSSLSGEGAEHTAVRRLALLRWQVNENTLFLLPRGILVCTDVMARGIDIPEVHWVLQYDPPSSARYNFRSWDAFSFWVVFLLLRYQLGTKSCIKHIPGG